MAKAKKVIKSTKKTTDKKTKISKKVAAKKSTEKNHKINLAKNKSTRTSVKNGKAAKKSVATKNNKDNSSSISQTKKIKSSNTKWNDFITPLDDRILVEPIMPSNKTTSGILIISSDAEDAIKARVLAAGKGHLNSKGHFTPMTVTAGDLVYLSKYSGTKLTLQNVEVMMIHENDVLGIIES